MTRSVEWSDLQVFLAVCERGSVGAAAQWLDVNHSTVLRRIASLEAALDARLFDRLPRGYVLTSQGQTLAASLGGVQDQFDSAQRRVTGADLALRGCIRLTAPDTLLHRLLLPMLADFSHRHSQLQFEIVGGNSFLNLTQREADVAVRGSNAPPENLVGRCVGRIQTALYGSREYLEALGADVAREDHWRWVGHDPALAHLEAAKWMRKHVPNERVALRVTSLVAMGQAVAAGFGVGWLLCPLGDATPDLVRLREPQSELDTQIWVLTHPDLRHVARIKAVTDFLYQQLSADPRLAH